MTAAMRAAMGEAAVKAALAIGYVGAGTVEFLVDASDGLRPDRFCFMEMNTRLQVEHPVTELVTGLDLVELQLRVADGEPLPFDQAGVRLDGHAFEARHLCRGRRARFPPCDRYTQHIAPAGGRGRAGRHRRGARATRITPHYDPMIAKLIVWGPDRTSALARLSRALGETRIAGSVTNVAFLARLAAHEGFAAGDVDTGLIGRDQAALTAVPVAPAEAMAVAALAQLGRLAPRPTGDPFAALGGFRSWGAARQAARFEGAEGRIDLLVTDSDAGFEVETPAGGICVAVMDGRDPDRLRLAFADRILTAGVAEETGAVTVFMDAVAHRFAHYSAEAHAEEGAGGDSVAAPMPGLVRAVRVAAGDQVEAGQALIVLEAMKMEHTMTAPRGGTVAEVLVAEGDQVEEGTLLLALETED